jgi:ParB-like chromosome segregation protein Spo0J
LGHEDYGRLARRYCPRPHPGQLAFEALAIEGHRSGALSHYEASQLLGLSRLEFERWLKRHHIDDHAYDVEDLEQDLKTQERLEASGLMPRS